jgi:hypothetical protein
MWTQHKKMKNAIEVKRNCVQLNKNYTQRRERKRVLVVGGEHSGDEVHVGVGIELQSYRGD